MTPPEQEAIDEWFDAVQAFQPPGTLAILLYDRDGKLTIGRGDVALEYQSFNLDNLPTALSLIAENVNAVYAGRPK